MPYIFIKWKPKKPKFFVCQLLIRCLVNGLLFKSKIWYRILINSMHTKIKSKTYKLQNM